MGIIWRDNEPGKQALRDALDRHQGSREYHPHFEADARKAIATMEVNREALFKQIARLVKARNYVRAKKLIAVVPHRNLHKRVYIATGILILVLLTLNAIMKG